VAVYGGEEYMNNEGIIKKLFSDCQKGGLQYFFSLVRVSGIERYVKDPILKLKEKTESGTVDRDYLDRSKAFWSLIVNLSRVGVGSGYSIDVFWASETNNYLNEALKLVTKDFSEYLKELFSDRKISLTDQQKNFLKKFFYHYESILKSFRKEYPLAKLPNFEVLELLTEKEGLNGFRVYFSNGSSAEFKRTKSLTRSINLVFEANGMVNFMAGDLNKMKSEWRVEDKPLYEIGLPGRYNLVGKWMPIIYPGKSGHLQKKALDATDEDRIQGVLFYIYSTSHWAIEFVAKMAVKFPEDETVFPNNIYMHGVKSESDHDLKNEYIYDGTLFLENTTIETIKNGLDAIQRTMDGIAFTFDSPVKWEVKYLIKGHQSGASLPNAKDIRLLSSILEVTQKQNDITIDTALSWYKLGLLTDNKLNSFLCFHIAIEGLAIKLARGELSSSSFFKLKPENKNAKAKKMKEVFDDYYRRYYEINLEKLINDAYFDCLGTITSNMKRAFMAVFGEKSSVVNEYFRGKDSLNSIRGQLAHGEYSDWHYNQYLEVWKKLPRIEEISQAFITRVILRISPDKKRPSWRRRRQLAISMFSPKGCLVASRLDIFPIKEWKIKPEWID